MTEDIPDTVQIILRKVPEHARPAASMFLSGCFSLPPSSTGAIASSAPIALLAGLSPEQADAILAELAPSLPQEIELVVSPEDAATAISRLQWPRPPRIYGKDIDDFAAPEKTASDVKCPICGGILRLTPEGTLLKAPLSHPTERRSSAAPPRQDAPAPDSPDDHDPLFSGVKPLAPVNTRYASIRSLQAGDTGFWLDNTGNFAASPLPPRESAPEDPARPPLPAPGESSHAKRARAAAGLAAFMKPGVFAIVLARTRDAQTVKMIAEIMGIPEPEAREKCLALSLTVARDISLDEAQNLLARLRTLGAKARIVKPDFS